MGEYRPIGHVHTTPDIFEITHFFSKKVGFCVWVREDRRPIPVKKYAVSEISGFVWMYL